MADKNEGLKEKGEIYDILLEELRDLEDDAMEYLIESKQQLSDNKNRSKKCPST